MKGLKIVKKVKKVELKTVDDFFKQPTPDTYILVINGKTYK